VTTTLEEIGNDIAQRWSIFRTARDIVDTKFDEGRNLAQDAFRIAQEQIDKITNLVNSLSPIDVNIASTFNDISPVDLDEFTAVAPVTPIVEVNLPDDLSDTDEIDKAVHDKLINDIQNGGPAIPADVEAAIVERDHERSLLIHQDALDSISAEWAKRGFTLPNGMLNAVLSQAIIEYNNKRLDVSRDVMIKSFELGDANTKFAVEQGIRWLGVRVEVHKAKIQAEIARVDAIVRTYLGQVEVYKGSAIVYAALTDVQIKRFDAELKMAVAKAELVIKDAEIDIKNYELLNQLKMEGLKSISAVAAQLAAGALSSVSAAAHIQASNSASYGYSPSPAKTVTTTNPDGSVSTVESSAS